MSVTEHLNSTLPDVDPVYELDDGEVTGHLLSVDIDGHGHDLDTVELVLAVRVDSDLLWREADYGPLCWEVTEVWRSTVPVEDSEVGAYEYVYRTTSSTSAEAVTHVEMAMPPAHWCVNHPHEPGQSGFPVDNFVDGEELVARDLARVETEAEPRRTVDDRGRTTYVYFCRPCSITIYERMEDARREARAAATGSAA